MTESNELKVPPGLAAALAADRTQLLSTMTTLEGYDALRIVRWLACSLIMTKEELRVAHVTSMRSLKKLDSVRLAHADLRAKIEALLQNEE